MKRLDEKIEEAKELRKQNKSLNEICKELCVAKSSVSIWTRGIEVIVEKNKNFLINKRKVYERNPKKCKMCGIDLTYKKRGNKFCSFSCSGKFNHPTLKRSSCLNCGKLVTYVKNKFCCLECSVENHWKERIKKVIETGNFPSTPKIAKDICIKMRGHKCEVCGIIEWVGQKAPLVLDHIDGDATNWKSGNLRLVCGNCDMQLPTYKSKNKNSKRIKRKGVW